MKTRLSWLALVILVLGVVGCGKRGGSGPLQPPVALLSDYGSRDPYAGQLKGALLTVNPRARIVDITHEIEPQNVRSGAYVLDMAAREFPAGAIFVAVIDPGAGNSRAPILVRTKAGHLFVGPDNGVFTLVIEKEGLDKAWALDQPEYFRSGADTIPFQGRDIFAPVAAHLSLGVDPEKIGTPLKQVQMLAFPAARMSGNSVTGQVLQADRYGNLITNVPADMAPFLRKGVLVRVTCGSQTITAPFVESYADVPASRYAVLANSGGRLEICLNQGSAAVQLKAPAGTTFTIKP